MNRYWLRKLLAEENSNSSNLIHHLKTVHRSNPGFTESCAKKSVNKHGRSSYQWLAEIIEPQKHKVVLDLACGSGPLLELCIQKFGENLTLIGVDMSDDELNVAKKRIKNKKTMFYKAYAQNLDFIPVNYIDVVLCHWALPLMNPLEPVLKEIRRVLKINGIFSAIIDGDFNLLSGYRDVHELIYSWANKEFSNYSSFELGDTRSRCPDKLLPLVKSIFKESYVSIESDVLEIRGDPLSLALEVSGFFYATYALSDNNRLKMLKDLEKFFIDNANSQNKALFEMPINKLTVF
ncbi:MAG: hypothetical protein CMP38_03895 [Rickettsiales bacterium]|nr:hypothetical protein [Rickettsiales bacterium]